MAIMDTLGQFGVNFDLDQETGDYLLTNQIDLGAANIALGSGQPVYVNFAVTEAFTDGGDSATVTFQVRSDDSASIHASTSSLHVQSKAFLKAELPIGQTFSLVLPATSGPEPYERYLGVQAVVGTAGFDAGMVTCWLSLTPVSAPLKGYADASN